MNLIYFILDFIDKFIDFTNSINVIFILLIFVFIYHTILFFLKDRKLIQTYNKFSDIKNISLKSLKEVPLINILIPAWKEGEVFRECLNSIVKLNYPKLKVIVNAGGNEQTMDIVNSFKNHKNFTILHQKGGSTRPSLGKIKALNECINYVNEGLVYFIDADSYLTDEILLRMIFPIVNMKENIVVGGVRPLKTQENKILVKYLQFERNANFKRKFKRYSDIKTFAGANTCIKYDILKKIGKFSTDKKYSTDRSMGEDIISKGFKFYRLHDYEHRIYVEFPNSIKEFVRQKTIWAENFLIYTLKKKSLLNLLKVLILSFISFYMILFPILIIYNVGLFGIGFSIFLSVLLKKIRKYIFFKSTISRQHKIKYPKWFIFSLIFFIYIEALNNFLIPFHFIYYITMLKKKSKK
ncbi:MAG: glycosyltransferase [Candidatus Helarchaeota archaeon]